MDEASLLLSMGPVNMPSMRQSFFQPRLSQLLSHADILADQLVQVRMLEDTTAVEDDRARGVVAYQELPAVDHLKSE